MRRPRISLILALAAAAGLVAFGPRREAADSAAARVVLDAKGGIFAPLVSASLRSLWVESLWREAEELESEGRVWDLAAVFERLAALDPDNTRVWSFQCRHLAWQIAQSESDDTMRWRLYRQALAHLRRGLELQPMDDVLRELEFRIHFDLLARDPWCSRQLQAATGLTALETAILLAERLHADFPESATAAHACLVAAERVAEFLFNRNQFTEAAICLVKLAELSEEIAQRFPGPGAGPRGGLCRLLAELLPGFVQAAGWTEGAGRPDARALDPPALVAILERAAAGLPPPDAVTRPFESFALNWLLVRSIRCLQALAEGDSPRRALPVLPTAHKIAALAAASSGTQMPWYSAAYVDLLGAFLVVDSSLLELRKGAMTPSAALHSTRDGLLEGLDRLVSDPQRAGASDGFKQRMSRLQR